MLDTEASRCSSVCSSFVFISISYFFVIPGALTCSSSRLVGWGTSVSLSSDFKSWVAPLSTKQLWNCFVIQKGVILQQTGFMVWVLFPIALNWHFFFCFSINYRESIFLLGSAYWRDEYLKSIFKVHYIFFFSLFLQLALRDPVHTVSLQQFVYEKLKAQQELLGEQGFHALMETVDTEVVAQLQEFLQGF